LFASLDTASQMLEIVARLPAALEVDEARCRAAVTKDLLATHDALALVKNGAPFRDAYRQIAEQARASNGASKEPAGAVSLPTYAGSPGKPDWNAVAADRKSWERWNAATRTTLQSSWRELLN